MKLWRWGLNRIKLVSLLLFTSSFRVISALWSMPQQKIQMHGCVASSVNVHRLARCVAVRCVLCCFIALQPPLRPSVLQTYGPHLFYLSLVGSTAGDEDHIRTNSSLRTKIRRLYHRRCKMRTRKSIHSRTMESHTGIRYGMYVYCIEELWGSTPGRRPEISNIQHKLEHYLEVIVHVL
jgi:hypothetical protein